MKPTPPLPNRLAAMLRLVHSRALGGAHSGAQAGGCATCELLREAHAAKLISGPWPSVIAWDGSTLNEKAGP